VLHKRNQESESLLMKLSQFLRFTLDTKASQTITLQEEFFLQKQYLDIEKIRFQDRLRVQIDIEKGVENACVPSLILQPLVENAIKHAIARSTEGGRILICAYKGNNALILIVEDNGPGVEDPAALFDFPSNGVGLKNIIDRLRLLYGTKGTFTLETASTGGLKAIISIPLSFESTPS
jgi:LytS/YehU family sensor histidine kinase